MKKAGFKGNMLLWAAAVLLYLTALTTAMVSGFYARYTTAGSSSDSARTAAFVFAVQDKKAEEVLSLDSLFPGCEDVEHTFTITNSQDGTVSEVAAAYSVKLEVLECGLPLTLILEDANGQTQTLDMLQGTEVAAEKECTMTGTLPAGTAAEEAYTLTIGWDEARNDAAYAGKDALLRITFTAQQIN